MRGKIPEQFKALQGKIRQAGLDDFKDWVRKCAEEAEKAESIGDTKAVFNIVKQMQGLSEKPPKNLNTDADGNVLLCADEVAATWHKLLKNKFAAATEEELNRPAMPALPATEDGNLLTRAEI